MISLHESLGMWGAVIQKTSGEALRTQVHAVNATKVLLRVRPCLIFTQYAHAMAFVPSAGANPAHASLNSMRREKLSISQRKG